MTKPSIGELLDGVASSLRESVLPEIPTGPTRRQIQVAISIIRRAAQVWDKTGPYLYVDNRDIEETLRQASLRLDRAESIGAAADLAGLRQRMHAVLDQSSASNVEYPSATALAARNVELQALLADLQLALQVPSSPTGSGTLESAARTEIVAMLHALLRRMLQRELEITAPSARR